MTLEEAKRKFDALIEIVTCDAVIVMLAILAGVALTFAVANKFTPPTETTMMTVRVTQLELATLATQLAIARKTDNVDITAAYDLLEAARDYIQEHKSSSDEKFYSSN